MLMLYLGQGTVEISKPEKLNLRSIWSHDQSDPGEQSCTVAVLALCTQYLEFAQTLYMSDFFAVYQ